MFSYSTAFYFIVFGSLSSTIASNCMRTRSLKEFKDLFIGKCLYYQDVINPEVFCERRVNCTNLWLLFTDAFVYKPKCGVNRYDYLDFIIASNHPVPANKFIFWEDVSSLVLRYSKQGQNKFTIADTLTGYLGNNLKWCGNSESVDGIEEIFQTCPGFELSRVCKSSAERAFWTIASEYYAKKAHGNIYIMLNSTSKPAFARNTYFATWELPNIKPRNVQRATILMVHELGQQIRETCRSRSIRLLKRMLNRRGIKSCCIDNPRDVLLLQCADSPSSEDCLDLI